MSLAERMLKKMGWREGEGLGKHGQGISTPLVAQKVAAGAGVIVAGSEMGPPEKRQRTGTVLQVGGRDLLRAAAWRVVVVAGGVVALALQGRCLVAAHALA